MDVCWCGIGGIGVVWCDIDGIGVLSMIGVMSVISVMHSWMCLRA
jgi:hypothetical protein